MPFCARSVVFVGSRLHYVITTAGRRRRQWLPDNKQIPSFLCASLIAPFPLVVFTLREGTGLVQWGVQPIVVTAHGSLQKLLKRWSHRVGVVIIIFVVIVLVTRRWWSSVVLSPRSSLHNSLSSACIVGGTGGDYCGSTIVHDDVDHWFPRAILVVIILHASSRGRLRQCLEFQAFAGYDQSWKMRR